MPADPPMLSAEWQFVPVSPSSSHNFFSALLLSTTNPTSYNRGKFSFYTSSWTLLSCCTMPLSYNGLHGHTSSLVSSCIDPFALQEVIMSLNSRTVTVSIVTFTTTIVTCLAVASPKQPARKIWGGFVNESGWSNKGIVFLTGLVNPNFGFGGLDGSIHLAEDCINATTVVPLATIFSIVTGVVTAFLFAVAMLYCITDIGSVLSTRTGQVCWNYRSSPWYWSWAGYLCMRSLPRLPDQEQLRLSSWFWWQVLPFSL